MSGVIEYAYFKLNGFDYRTDGVSVQGKDGNSWNTTHSLRIILAAREAWSNNVSDSATEVL